MSKPLPDPRWASPELLARGISRFAPFKSWPLPALLRLARAGSVSSHPPGAVLIAYARPQDVLSIVLEGASQVTITDAGGRRITFLYDGSTMVYAGGPRSEQSHDRREPAVAHVPGCRQQIELSGLVASRLSAFLV